MQLRGPQRERRRREAARTAAPPLAQSALPVSAAPFPQSMWSPPIWQPRPDYHQPPDRHKDARVDDYVRDACKLRSPAQSLDRSNVALHTRTHVDDALSSQCCAGLKFLYGVYMPRWQVQHFASRRVICFCATSIMSGSNQLSCATWQSLTSSSLWWMILQLRWYLA
jgi:hypothetical protein